MNPVEAILTGVVKCQGILEGCLPLSTLPVTPAYSPVAGSGQVRLVAIAPPGQATSAMGSQIRGEVVKWVRTIPAMNGQVGGDRPWWRSG
jgi:hypothetical protein